NAQSLNLGTTGVVTNSATGGSISVAVTGAGNDLTISNTVSAGGGVPLSAARDVGFAQAASTTGVSAGGAATLTAGGAIVGNANAATDVAATSLTANAATGIGSANALETNVATLTATNSTSGNVSISNAQSLNLGGGSTVTNSAAAGNISVAV